MQCCKQVPARCPRTRIAEVSVPGLEQLFLLGLEIAQELLRPLVVRLHPPVNSIVPLLVEPRSKYPVL